MTAGLEPEPRDTVHVSVDADGAVEARNAAGAGVRIGPPGTPEAFTPVELLLLALGGCGAIDVVNITTKQRRPVVPFEIEVRGWRAVGEHRVARVRVDYWIDVGDECEANVRRAIELTAETYCTVSRTLVHETEVVHELARRDQD